MKNATSMLGFEGGCFALLMMSLSISAAIPAHAAGAVVPPQSSAFGSKFEEWSAQWWQLALSLPVADNPLLDITGAKCAVGQRGPVWFLFGALQEQPVTRSCSVPEGKALFFPVLNLVDINTTTQTAVELRAEIAPCLDSAMELSVTVDGQSIPRLFEKFRVRSIVFDVTIPGDGLLDPGVYSPAVDDGYYVMLQPLSVGPHAIHIAARSAGCNFALDVTYRLDIVPASLQ